MLKVVFDTNIYVSAIMHNGTPKKLYEASIERKFLLITSPPLMLELAGVLRNQFQFEEPAITIYLKQIARLAEIVKPIIIVNAVISDPDDNRVIECALKAKADIIVSSDKHLLGLKKYGSIQIIKAIDMARTCGIVK